MCSFAGTEKWLSTLAVVASWGITYLQCETTSVPFSNLFRKAVTVNNSFLSATAMAVRYVFVQVLCSAKHPRWCLVPFAASQHSHSWDCFSTKYSSDCFWEAVGFSGFTSDPYCLHEEHFLKHGAVDFFFFWQIHRVIWKATLGITFLSFMSIPHITDTICFYICQHT